ncbi:putative FMN-binding regulatory protein PaiB [Rhizobium binae]|uniref:FMN-binding regulatory protein PaiB n=1 Tax=Rhizobium binae TaxID=1138190 RepID=A0ABV2MN93_9HYPH
MYASKAEHGKVVPTWNYTAVHACGPVEFFEEAERLFEIVSRLTRIHEVSRSLPWSVTDAPEAYIHAQIRGINGIRPPVVSLQGKCKMSQNRPAADRNGVKQGLGDSGSPTDQIVSDMIFG